MNPYLFAFLLGALIGTVLGLGGLVTWFVVKWKWVDA